MSKHTPHNYRLAEIKQGTGFTNAARFVQLEDYDALLAENARLRQWLLVILDQVDYTAGACSLTEMVGAVLDKTIIEQARAALAEPAKDKEPTDG